MFSMKFLFIGAALLVGATAAAEAQYAAPPAYPAYPYIQYYPSAVPPAAPQSWSYDPYTSGMTACPQGDRKHPCTPLTIAPTAGQPNYWRW